MFSACSVMMDTSTPTAAGRPPLLSAQQVCALVTRYFNLSNVCKNSVGNLPSYSDRNYHLQGESDDKYVLKVMNPLCTSCVGVEGILQVLRHLDSCFLATTPHPMTTQSGEYLIELSSAELKTGVANAELRTGDNELRTLDLKYPVFLLTFIPGLMFDHVDKHFLTPALLYEVGELLGKIDLELMVCIKLSLINSWHFMRHGVRINSQYSCAGCLGHGVGINS